MATPTPPNKLTEATLPIAGDLPDGASLYHIRTNPDQFCGNILISGDPDRVKFIANKYLAKPYIHKVNHRGLRLYTGFTKECVLPGNKQMKMTVATSGMGTPSLEIVLGELIALNELQLPERIRLEKRREMLNIIRVGTSGAVREQTQLGTSVITKYAIGMDNTGLFYDAPLPDAVCGEIERQALHLLQQATPPGRRFAGCIHPYASKAHPQVVEALVKAANDLKAKKNSSTPLHTVGITVSNAGFFANQGRDVYANLAPTIPGIDAVIGQLSVKDCDNNALYVENLEMEVSLLAHIGHANEYRCGAVCAAVANRVTNSFAKNTHEATMDAIEIGFRALVELNL